MEDNSAYYDVTISREAQDDLDSKYGYISRKLHSPRVAYNWLMRVRREIFDNLTTFPNKYREFDSSGRRIFVSRTDIILYSVDEESRVVIVNAVSTRGKDLGSLAE